MFWAEKVGSVLLREVFKIKKINISYPFRCLYGNT